MECKSWYVFMVTACAQYKWLENTHSTFLSSFATLTVLSFFSHFSFIGNKTEFSAQQATQRFISSVSGSNDKNRMSSQGWTTPSANHPSKYNKAWEPYIAANLFLYTVPLAIFLRRARELDFSPKMFNRSMTIVKRVFRIYSPEVVSAISNLLQSTVPGTSVSSSVARSMQQMVSFHVATLGQHSPVAGTNPVESLSLKNCEADMSALLEEVYMQHMKKIRDLGLIDKVASFIEGFFGHGVISGEEKAIAYLLERAKLIIGMPIDQAILSINALGSVGTKGSGTTTDTMQRFRTDEGILTEAGRDQILRGRVKCNPADIKYIGDKMTARVTSHEIALLVTLTIALSNWLNNKLGLIDKDKAPLPFRINLRFLADYRNILFLGCCYMFLKALF